MSTVSLLFIISLFINGVFGDIVSVIDGDSVTLHIDVTDEQRNDQIHWKIKHKNFTVAEIITENGTISRSYIDERFRGRLKLDDQTGSLIITNMKTEDSMKQTPSVTHILYTRHSGRASLGLMFSELRFGR